MNIKEQVLSIAQVQELQELGLDVEKYASMCWLPPANEVNSFSPVNKQFWNAAELKYIPTLTIGDILDVLPKTILSKGSCYRFEMKFNNDLDCNISYYCRDHFMREIDEFLYYPLHLKIIDSLFLVLKWCIKQKHICLMTNRKEEKPKLTCYLGDDMAR